MGLGFKRSFKVAPGVRINNRKRVASVSIGGKGLTTNLSKRGVRTTASHRGTGLCYTTKSKFPRREKRKEVLETQISNAEPRFFVNLFSVLVVFGVIIAVASWWV